MSEIPFSPEQKQFTISLFNAPKEIRSSELSGMYDWLNREIGRLPEMKVTRSPLTNGRDWKKEPATNGEIDRVTSNFFTVEGLDVKGGSHAWHQGAVIQRSESLPTSTGERTSVSGFLILVTNPRGETFVTVAQEPLASAVYRTPDKTVKTAWVPQGTELHPVIRTPIQASVEKFQKITTNESLGMQYDPTFTKLLKVMAEERHQSFADIIKSIPLSKAPTDANRIASDVFYGQVRVSEAAAQKIGEAIPEGRWCSQKELDALVVSGLSNGHFNVARSVIEAQNRLTGSASR